MNPPPSLIPPHWLAAHQPAGDGELGVGRWHSRVWSPHSPSYVVPTSLSHGIKLVNPMFRGYAQQVGHLSCPGDTRGHDLPGLALKPRCAWKRAQRLSAVRWVLPLPEPFTLRT